MRIYLETERLLLRQFEDGDVDNLIALDADPEVRRYLCMPQAPDRATETEALERFRSWYADGGGYGFWAAIEKASGDFIGWFHLRPSREDPAEAEIGWRLRRISWNKGYATEGAKALIRKGFKQLDLPRIVAMAIEANRASTRVMEKAGMRLEKRYHYQGVPAVKYVIDRPRL